MKYFETRCPSRASLGAAITVAIVYTTLAPRVAAAQDGQERLPSTTDCPLRANDHCITRYNNALRERALAESDASYQRGMRAFAGISLAVGVPQLVGGVVAATEATPQTQNVGHSVAWVMNGTILTVTGTVFAMLRFERPRAATRDPGNWISTALFGLASIGHGAWAAATWIAPPQDVSATKTHLFGAAMVGNALWYATAAILPHFDWRDHRLLALERLTPTFASDGRATTFGVTGRF
jgi:hypothetical protein